MMMTVVSTTGTRSRFAQLAETLAATGQKAFMPYVLLGWPSEAEAWALVKTYVENGAHALEVGLAFSEPIADGPILQQAITDVLNSGYRVDQGLAFLARVREAYPDLPLCLMTYFNPVAVRGAEAFARQVKAAGVDALLVVDLPPEQAETELIPAVQGAELDAVFIVSPLTKPDRLARLLTFAGGYLYVVSRLGITGVESRYDVDLGGLLAAVKASNPGLPLFVGFGVSSPQNAQTMFAMGADGVISASRIMQLLLDARAAGTPSGDAMAAVGEYVRAMVATTRPGANA
jgi:tryptophan synthase alpha chain